MLVPGTILRPSNDDLELIGHELSDMIDDLEAEYHSLLTVDIPAWWQWYHAVPRRRERIFPFTAAANVVVPLIAQQADALISRTYSSLFGAGDRVWVVATEREDLRAKAKNVERAANWSVNHGSNIKLSVYDWLSELFVIGSSVLAINYRRDQRALFFGQGAARLNGRVPIQRQVVEFSRGVLYDHVPREQILWDTRYRIADAPLVVREHRYSKSQLSQMSIRDPAWLSEQVKEVFQDTGSYAPSKDVADLKDRLDSRTRGFSPPLGEEHDIRECHIDWPILRTMGFEDPADPDPTAPTIPIVIHLHRKTQKVLRLVAEPYHLPGKPFFDGFFRKDSARGHGTGVAKKLEMLQRILTTLYNQAIDSQTRANAIWAQTSDPRWQTTPIDPSRPLFTPNLDSFKPLDIGTSVQPNIALMNIANIFAERITGISDPAFGRESRQGGHPSPATSTLALLEQGVQMSASTALLLREQVSAMGQGWAILTQQYETNADGSLERIFGPSDARDISDLIFPTEPIPQHYLFDVRALSETLNPDTEMRRAVVVSQMNRDFWAFVLQGAQVITSNQFPPAMGQLWLQAIEAQRSAYERFLEGANVDDIERFTGQLRNAVESGSQQQLAGAMGTAREIAAGAGSVPGQGPLGTSPGGPQGGAGLPPAGGGSLLQ